MKKTLKRLWVKALRSEEYRQGTGTLATTSLIDGELAEFPTEFCCLGVLCDVAFDDWWYEERVDNSYNEHSILVPAKRTWHFGRGNTERHKNAALLSPAMLKKVGLTSQQQDVLAKMNDAGSTFERIAEWIDLNL